MPKTALRELLAQLQEHLDEDSAADITAADRDLLVRVHDDIEDVLEITAEVPHPRAQETRSILDEAAAELGAHPIGAAIGRVAEILAGMGI